MGAKACFGPFPHKSPRHCLGLSLAVDDVPPVPFGCPDVPGVTVILVCQVSPSPDHGSGTKLTGIRIDALSTRVWPLRAGGEVHVSRDLPIPPRTADWPSSGLEGVPAA